MAILQFNKQALGNLEYSLQREMLSTNRAGGYMNTTIVCCNTRKYHGLMVCPVEALGGEDFVLLSSLDETVIQHEQEFNLAIHRYPGVYEPRGHKYIVDFSYTPTPTIIYRVGGVLLKKEMLWVHTAEQLLIRYTLLEARSATKLRLRPFLAFRSRHGLSHENMEADGTSYPIPGGVKARLYPRFPWLHMQINKPAKFVQAPDWYHNFEYLEEERRGYPFREDLLTTGYFEMEIATGESIIFSGSTSEVHPEQLGAIFEEEIARRTVKTEFMPALYHSARQFLIIKENHTSLTAGYPWYNARSRETFMALAGVTLSQPKPMVEQCVEILDYHVENRLHDGIFGTHFAADTQLWFFYALQQLERFIDGGKGEIWARYGSAMKEILYAYRDGVGNDRAENENDWYDDERERYIHMADNGLIWADMPGRALTWMNAMNDGQPVTRRPGFAVEVNALWYNAVCYALELAGLCGDDTFVREWVEMPGRIQDNFKATFWLEHNPQQPYLADYVYRDSEKNTDIRPNMLLACSLPYSPLNEYEQQKIMTVIEAYLLTPRGLRTLSPNNPQYQGICRGNEYVRNIARHQGTVFPWLLEHYVRTGFKLYGMGYLATAKELLGGFEEDLLNYGIGSVPEGYDGDAPHEPCGAISYAPSVAALLQINRMIHEMERGS